METENATLTIRIPRAMKDHITKTAKADDLTVSQYIRRHFAEKLKPVCAAKKKGQAAA